MKVHHIGYAVKNIEDSIKEFERLGYSKVKNTVIDNKRNVIIQFIQNEEYLIELVAPLKEESPVTNILKKQGNSPYHICYETNDIDNKIKELSNNGFTIIAKLSEAPAINNKKVVFLYKRDAGLIELIKR